MIFCPKKRSSTGRGLRIALFLCASLFVAGLTPASAHHSWVGYDSNARTSVSGSVEAVEFVNPHARLRLAVTKPDGTIEHWVFEGGSVSRLRRAGWSEDTLKAGDEITVDFHPKHDGSPGGIFRRITWTDGRVQRAPLNGLLDGLFDSVLDPGPD